MCQSKPPLPLAATPVVLGSDDHATAIPDHSLDGTVGTHEEPPLLANQYEVVCTANGLNLIR